MKKLALILIAGFFMGFSDLQAQVIEFSGQVVDSTGQPLPFANVIGENIETKTIDGFAVADETASFSIKLKAHTDYLIKVSFVGFQSFERKFRFENEDYQNIKIELKVATEMLNEVQVVKEMPVTLSGDTLVYKADAFTNGRERKLKDVLKKMPGIEVEDDGSITVQGKKVNDVLVEGKKFFDGDSKMATNNLPANAVDKVQVLNDYSEFGPTGQLQSSERLALNIQLKVDKKNLLFGSVEAGAGPEKRYALNSNVFYYAPKLNINVIADANNIGEQAFGLQDYYRFGGGIDRNGTVNSLKVENTHPSVNLPNADRTNAATLENQLGALNLNYKPSKKWQHDAFVIGSFADLTFRNLSDRQYFSDDYLQETYSSTNQYEVGTAFLKHTLTYTPNVDNYAKLSTFSKIAETTSLMQEVSVVQNSADTFSTARLIKPFEFQQAYEWYHVINVKNILTTDAFYSFDNRSTQLNLVNNQPFLTSYFPGSIGQASPVSFDQSSDNYNFNLRANTDYYYVLNKKNHVKFGVGFQSLNQRFQNSLSTASNEERESLEPFKGDERLQFQSVGLSMSSKHKIKSFEFFPALDLQGYLENRREQAQWYLLPSMRLRWSRRSTETMEVSYRKHVEVPSVLKTSEFLRLLSYNQISQGNAVLRQGIYHSLDFNYRYFNLFDGITAFLNTSYNRRINKSIESIRFSGIESFNSFTNSIQPLQDFNAQLYASKTFKYFKIKADYAFNIMEDNNVVNEEVGVQKSNAQQFSASFTTTLFKAVDISINHEQSFNRYLNRGRTSVFTNTAPSVSVDWRVLSFLNLQSEYGANRFLNTESGSASRFDLWDASIEIRPTDKAWSMTINGYNLLNTQAVSRNSQTDNFVSSYQYFIQKRYVMFNVGWQF